jgi:hypothetical protein
MKSNAPSAPLTQKILDYERVVRVNDYTNVQGSQQSGFFAGFGKTR